MEFFFNYVSKYCPMLLVNRLLRYQISFVCSGHQRKLYTSNFFLRKLLYAVL